MTTKPDFDEWALNIIDTYFNSRRDKFERDSLAEHLRLAYEQGYHYGLNNGWVDEQEKSIQYRSPVPSTGRDTLSDDDMGFTYGGKK